MFLGHFKKNHSQGETGLANVLWSIKELNKFLALKYRHQLMPPSGGCSLVARMVDKGFF